MTKAKYPPGPNEDALKSLATNLREFSSALDNWARARENTFQAQYKLLQSCKNDAEVKRYKAMGLLNF